MHVEHYASPSAGTTSCPVLALSQCIGVVHIEGFCHYFTPRAGTTSCPVLAVHVEGFCHSASPRAGTTSCPVLALSQCIGVVHVEGFCHYFTPRAGTTSCPVLAARHRRRKQGGRGAFAPEKNCLVGSLLTRKCGTDGHVNLTQQLSPCSMGQSGTVALVGFAFEAIF